MIGDERGITLTELMVALAITGLITGILATAMYQINQVTGWGNNELRVQHDLQNAATWLNRDVRRASSAHVVSASQMILTVPYDVYSTMTGTVTIYARVITYTLTDSTLTRDSDGSTLIVARHVNSFIPSPTGMVTSVITITITSAITSQVGDVAGSATLHLDMRPEPTPTPTVSP